MYPGRGDPREPPGICAMTFTNMFLSIILSIEIDLNCLLRRPGDGLLAFLMTDPKENPDESEQRSMK